MAADLHAARQLAYANAFAKAASSTPLVSTLLSTHNVGGKQKTAGITVRSLVSKKKKRFVADGADLDLTYVTDRIIAMGFPSVGLEGLYRNPATEVRSFLERRHGDHYRIWNLCVEKDYAAAALGLRCDVERFCWADHTPPPLAMMRQACDSMSSWLAAHPENVAIVHCKAGKGRTGTIIAAFLVHSRACRDADEAMILFGERRTRNGRGVTIPSQMRFVRYYAHQRVAMNEEHAGWPDPLPLPDAVFVVSDAEESANKSSSPAISNPLDARSAPGESQDAPAPGDARARIVWKSRDADEAGGVLIHVELHRSSDRNAGFAVVPDSAGRLVVESVNPSVSLEAEPEQGSLRPAASVLFPGDEIIAVGEAPEQPDMGSLSFPEHSANWQDGVRRLRVAPDPMRFTIFRWETAGVREGAQEPIKPWHLHPARTPSEYISRLCRAVGPWAPGSDPRVVPLPTIQVTSLSFSHYPVAKADSLPARTAALCGKCLHCLTCGIFGCCTAGHGAPSAQAKVRVQIYSGVLCRTLVFDSGAVDKATPADWGLGASRNDDKLLHPSTAGSSREVLPSAVTQVVGGLASGWEGGYSAEEVLKVAYGPVAGDITSGNNRPDGERSPAQSDEDEEEGGIPMGPNGDTGAGKSSPEEASSGKCRQNASVQSAKGGALGPGSDWEAPASATLGREMCRGIRTDEGALQPLDAESGPLESPALVWGPSHFCQKALLPVSSLEDRIHGPDADRVRAVKASAVSPEPREVLVAGDFKLVIMVVGRKKPIATAWLHTAELPLPAAARSILAPHLAPVQAAVRARDMAEKLSTVGVTATDLGPSILGTRVTFRRESKAPTAAAASDHLTSPTAGLIHVAGTPQSGAEALAESPRSDHSTLNAVSQEMQHYPPSAGIGGDILASHATVGTPTLGAIFTAAAGSGWDAGVGLGKGEVEPSQSVGSLVLCKRQLDGPGGVKDKKHAMWPSTARIAFTYRIVATPPIYRQSLKSTSDKR